ncbi:hypothetical protein DYB31_009991 [Aphanomyces astaci]|uniref:PiggyBac transposable element-derived protein domain-containing protein n=1 Tax=Aphanomyces astaci TaxID=112090 RepID=A0A397EB34_APHAT|nr:hypothetical protein DYB31_009991 [Aphanomyces astaci]
METCSVCGAHDGPTLRQCNICASKFHHMCIVEEAAKNGWPEPEEGQELCESTPKKRGRPPKSPSSANMPSTPSEVDVTPIPVGVSEFTPDLKSIRSNTMFRNVLFRPLQETQIYKNDKKLLAFYADCKDFMLSGVVTEMRYVVGSENDPDIDTPDKNTKAEVKAMVALYKITCVEQLRLCRRTNKFLAKSSFDEETKSDEGTNDGSLAPQDDDGSGDEWSEYVDRGWKKHRHYDATEDIQGLEDVEWTYGGHYAGPTDLYEHQDSKDDTPVDELRISEEFKHLFKDPVKDFLAFMPLACWKTVTVRTNAKAVALQAAHPKGYVGGREFKKSIDLVEVMKFVSLLIVMSVVQGGEYSLYWSKPSMSFLMPPTENFGRVMPIDRFKQLRADQHGQLGDGQASEVSYDQRMRRYCVVCYFERNKELIKTQWCDVHKVYLCTKAYEPSDQQVPAHVCPHVAWSCWDKFHSFYHPKGLFKKDGKMDAGSELYKLKKHSVMEHNASSVKKTLI